MVKHFKEGAFKMCEAFDKYALKKLVDAADNLIHNRNFSIEEACEIVNITIEDYKAVKEKELVLA